jgi:transcriptional regulator with XRE-family HTH domain
MRITAQTTDEVVLTEMGRRLARTRLQLNLTQAQLATQAGVSKRTLERMESGQVGAQLSGFIRVCRALGLLDRLDSFLPEPTPSPMEQLRLAGRQRQRASGDHYVVEEPRAEWKWGDEP